MTEERYATVRHWGPTNGMPREEEGISMGAVHEGYDLGPTVVAAREGWGPTVVVEHVRKRFGSRVVTEVVERRSGEDRPNVQFLRYAAFR